MRYLKTPSMLLAGLDSPLITRSPLQFRARNSHGLPTVLAKARARLPKVLQSPNNSLFAFGVVHLHSRVVRRATRSHTNLRLSLRIIRST